MKLRTILAKLFCTLGVSLFLTVHFHVLPAYAAGTLDKVKERGKLACGVSEGLPGFSHKDSSGKWTGFDVDFCRAVSAAIFGDGDKVEYVPLSAGNRFEALSSGKVDILSRNTTWTLGRDVDMEFEFIAVSYYDGQGFLTRLDHGLSSALQLDGEKVCVLAGTTSVDNAKSFFERAKLKVELAEHEKREDALAAYAKDECRAYSADRSALASQRTSLTKPDDHVLLPEVISKEPLGPVVRQDDPAWSDLARWTFFLLVNSEEEASEITVPASVAKKLGLDDGWAKKVIGTVGNYGAIFERNLGERSPLKLERGLNALWTRGGILYAPPMR